MSSAMSSAMASPNNTPSVRVSSLLLFRCRAGSLGQVADLLHCSPYIPTLISFSQTLPIRPATALLLLILIGRQAYTSHRQCLARSTSSTLSHQSVFSFVYCPAPLLTIILQRQSRPTSNTFSDEINIPGVTTSERGMLSAEDAHNRPLPSVESPRVQPPPIPVVDRPPPNFVQFGSSPAQ